jgi:hypothetical protein
VVLLLPVVLLLVVHRCCCCWPAAVLLLLVWELQVRGLLLLQAALAPRLLPSLIASFSCRCC